MWDVWVRVAFVPTHDWKLPSVMMRYTLWSFIFQLPLVKLRLTDETVALDSGRPGTEVNLCCYWLHHGSSVSGIKCLIIWGGANIIEIKCSINVMHLNHPKTTPHAIPRKNCLPWNPGTKKAGDRWAVCPSSGRLTSLNVIVLACTKWLY